ncbi:MAG: hypothetical protein R6T98_13705 [Desulfatiglandales bacterium]
MKNPAIFTIPKKTMDFFEVTGGLRLVEPPARREGCCLFVTYHWGNPQAPIYRGNAEGLRLGEPPARRGQNSPMDTLLKRPTREPRPPARRAYAPEGTEKKPIVFRSIGVMQRSRTYPL